MILVTFLLAALAVLARTKLAPDLADARGTAVTAGVTGPISALINLVDAERNRAGCAALHIDGGLTSSAEGHTADMAGRGYAGGVGSDGSGPQQRAAAAGYRGQW